MAVMQETKKKEELVDTATTLGVASRALKGVDKAVRAASSVSGKVARAELKDALISPQKGRLVANLVRGMKALHALDVLSLTRKKAAVMFRKAIGSAVASAENNFGMDKKDLVISRIFVDEGVKFPRYRIVSRGRGHQYTRRRSRVVVELTNRLRNES